MESLRAQPGRRVRLIRGVSSYFKGNEVTVVGESLTSWNRSHISINKEKMFERHDLSPSCCSKNKEIKDSNCPALAFRGEYNLKSANSEISSMKSVQKENSFVTEYVLNPNVVHIMGNLLRDCKERTKCHPCAAELVYPHVRVLRMHSN